MFVQTASGRALRHTVVQRPSYVEIQMAYAFDTALCTSLRRGRAPRGQRVVSLAASRIYCSRSCKCHDRTHFAFQRGATVHTAATHQPGLL